MNSPDPDIAKRARSLQKGLRDRIWTYTGKDGKVRSHKAGFKRAFTNNGRLIVQFNSTAKLPVSYLSEKDQKWVQAVLRIQAQVEQDGLRHVELVRQIEEARKAAELEELDRRDPLVRIATLLVDARAEVSVDGEPRSMQVKRGEQFVVLDIQGGLVVISVGGQRGDISSRDASITEVRSSRLPDRPRHQVRRVPANEPPVEVWPKRLDVDFDFEDGGNVIRIVLKEVFRGGVGYRMGSLDCDAVTLFSL